MTKLLARLLTRSFPGSRDDAFTPALTEPGPAADDSYESRAFAGWNELVTDRSATKILDLGPLRPRALNFFAERSIDLGILNLEPAGIAEQLRQFNDRGPYQGFLGWDLPNYCKDVDELEALGTWLAQRLTAGAPGFLSLSTKAPYGDRPSVYEVLGVDRLRVVPVAGQARDVLFSGSRLAKVWPEFEVKRSFLLRSGMQEFVLARR